MNPPPNPHAAESSAAIREYNAPLLANPPHIEYRLTWPAAQHGVICIAGQWQRNESGDIEAWYSAAQLRDILAAMQAAQAAHDAPER